jgi:hypothetical protein
MRSSMWSKVIRRCGRTAVSLLKEITVEVSSSFASACMNAQIHVSTTCADGLSWATRPILRRAMMLFYTESGLILSQSRISHEPSKRH